MNSSQQSAQKPVSRTRATVLMAIGGYANTGISIIQGLILIPLYIHYIGAHTYGVWLATGGVLAWLGFVDMGIGSMMVQRIACAYGQRDYPKAALYFTNGMIFYSLMTAVFLLLGYCASWWVLPFIYTGAESKLLQHCFQIAVLATGVNLLNECLRAFAQAILRPVFAIVSLIIGRLFGLALTIGLLFYEFGLWSIPLGMALTSGIVLLLNIVNVTRIFRILGTKIVVSKEVIKEYLSLSPALFAGRIGRSMVKEIEPLLITVVLSKPELATAYVIMKRAADIVSNMLSVIVASTAPSFSNLAGEKSSEETAKSAQIITVLLFVSGLVGFGGYAALNESFVHLWVGDEFLLGSHVTLIIAMGSLAMLLANSTNRLLIGLGDIKKPSVWVLIEAIFRLVTMYFLLDMIGIEGIPLALLVTSTIFCVVLLRRMKNIIPIVFSWGLLKYVLAFLVVFSFSILANIYAPLSYNWGMFVLEGGVVSVVLITFAVYFDPLLRRTILERLLFKRRT